LCTLAEALRPGGVAFLQTLCAQSLSVLFQTRGWIYYGRGHLQMPTLVSFEHYFEKAGLVPIRFETHGFRSSNTPRYKQTRQRRRRFDKLMSNIAGRLRRGHRAKVLLQKGEQ
jgi:hypothetical protein